MPLLIQYQTDLPPPLNAAAILTAPLAVLLQHEAVPGDPEISLVFCDDPFIQSLNAEYRGKNKPTDVLSFAQDDPELLGDIIISLPTATRQAEAARWPLENEITLLGVHGLLHLLGYDDETEAGAWEMQRRTEVVLFECGLAIPSGGMHPFFVEVPG
ncbi:MAG: rRNA maturation RNase YbeY [Janthinobacterium lividum]